MAVLTRCELEWRFHSGPIVFASGNKYPNKLSTATDNLDIHHGVISRTCFAVRVAFRLQYALVRNKRDDFSKSSVGSESLEEV